MEHKTPDLTMLVEKTKSKCEDFIINGDWFEHYNDGCPYDNSGDTRRITKPKIDYISSLDVEFLRPLSQIYLGHWTASHCSGSGKNHETLETDLCEEFVNEALEEFLTLNDTCDNDELTEYFYGEYHCGDVLNAFEDLANYYTKGKVIEVLSR
jgi:hypothetical protein